MLEKRLMLKQDLYMILTTNSPVLHTMLGITTIVY